MTYHKLSIDQHGHIYLAKSCQKIPKRDKELKKRAHMTRIDLGAFRRSEASHITKDNFKIDISIAFLLTQEN